MARSNVLSLFAAYGIELEYMIVDEQTLVPQPICQQVLFDLAQRDTMVVEMGEVAWSNELALHVIELKANGPKDDLPALHRHMATALGEMNAFLKRYHAMLLPTAMHPFFVPEGDAVRLWAAEDALIYKSFDRIFGCKGHGWANLQSTHLNLPFNGDDEFARLHSAIRLILPLLPALAASSPYVEGKAGPFLDSRLHYYLANQRKISAIIGDAIPEAVSSEREYQERILKPMYRAIAPYDPQGILQHEWLNSRAAIARFERNAIEIRILDIQECLAGDFSLLSAIIAALKNLCLALGEDLSAQQGIAQETLVATLQGALREGMAYAISDATYLEILGTRGRTIGEIWAGWVPEDSAYRSTFVHLLQRGSLAGAILKQCGPTPSHQELISTYQQLAYCLADDNLFTPSAVGH